MKKLLFVLSLSFTAALFTACGNTVDEYQEEQAAEANAPAPAPATEALPEISPYGIYEGTIPAADAGGINIKLTLNKDRTAILDVAYIKEEEEPFTETGSFVIDGDIVRLVVQGDIHYYKIGKAKLDVLTPEGELITGNMAHLYVLRQMQEFK